MISFVFLPPVCPNCHAMLHRRKPPFTLEELKALMGANKPN
ncbi:HNH endonuclease [Escherichia fergusonii]|nr:HNH endonuclease [Escherichia fergusonii]HCO7574031.1 HNH endonuclease [Escherichia fergusonii]